MLDRKISELDLGAIGERIVRTHGWPQARVREAVTRYRQFLQAALTDEPGSEMADEDADTVWHFHILDSMKYHNDCQAIFGRYLHHVPNDERLGASLCGKCDRVFASQRH